MVVIYEGIYQSIIIHRYPQVEIFVDLKVRNCIRFSPGNGSTVTKLVRPAFWYYEPVFYFANHNLVKDLVRGDFRKLIVIFVVVHSNIPSS